MVHPVSRRKSLSARRAWIEMGDMELSEASKAVALRKESVDRNSGKAPYMENAVVALRKESVDRNEFLATLGKLRRSRSPQGERG